MDRSHGDGFRTGDLRDTAHQIRGACRAGRLVAMTRPSPADQTPGTDTDSRGVSEPPGRPRGRQPGQKGGSLTPRPLSSVLVGDDWRGKERRSAMSQNAGGKLLTARD